MLMVALIFGVIAATALILFIIFLIAKFGYRKEVNVALVTTGVIAGVCLILGMIFGNAGWQMARGRATTPAAYQQLKAQGYDVVDLSVSEGWAQVILPGGCIANFDLYQRTQYGVLCDPTWRSSTRRPGKLPLTAAPRGGASRL